MYAILAYIWRILLSGKWVNCKYPGDDILRFNQCGPKKHEGQKQ